ncbi:uncharacterized protein LOC135395721 [Ornithodoros turicata]|uniref:uncharacterized protein LOC135395721 n=1 Tax=Ornithodoros turicata TaxID=34597 RepID=UPI0031396247
MRSVSLVLSPSFAPTFAISPVLTTDALSRINAVPYLPSPVSVSDLLNAQAHDADLKDYLAGESSLVLQKVHLPGCVDPLFCDVSTAHPCPFVPEPLRRRIFSEYHSLAHTGVRATQKAIATRYVWPNINKDIRSWTRSCLACQRTKVERHIQTPLKAFPTPEGRFCHVHLDLVGPLPSSLGCRYLFTCVDRFTRWAEALPIPDATADTVGRAFLLGWVARFGCPDIVTTDRGRQFTSRSFTSLLKAIGTKHMMTTAYHPAANGMVERLHRQLKAALCSQPEPTNWVDHLPWVLLGLCSSLKQNLKCSSAELVFGSPLRLPGDFLDYRPKPPTTGDDFATCLRQHFQAVKPALPRQPSHRKIFVYPDLANASHAFVRVDHAKPPLHMLALTRYWPAATRPSVDLNGRRETISLDRVKYAHLETLVAPVHLLDLPSHCGGPQRRRCPSAQCFLAFSPGYHQGLGGEACSSTSSIG